MGRWIPMAVLAAVAVVIFLVGDGSEPGPNGGDPIRRESEDPDAAPPLLRGPAEVPSPEPSQPADAVASPPSDAVARLVVRVVHGPGDAPLEGADVRIRDANGNEETHRTPADGTVEITRGTTSTVIVSATHEGFVPGDTSELTLVLRKTKTWSIQMETGVAITGVVLRDEDGVPVVGARVRATAGGNVGGILSSRSRDPFGFSRTDRAGRFHFPALPPHDICTVAVRAPGFRQAEHSFFPKDVTGRDDAIVIRLEPGARITGRVYDPDGNPLEGARVRLDYENDLSGKTDASGVYVIDGLAFDQRYGAVAYGPGFASSEEVEDVFATRAEPETVLDLTLRRLSALRVHLVDAEGEPVDGEAEAFLGPWPFSGWQAEGEAPGVWRFDDVDPGPQRLQIDAPGYLRVDRRVVVEEGGLTEVTVTLRAGTTITGIVVDDRGEALAGARVAADMSSPGGVTTKSGDDGRFRLEGLKAGTVRINTFVKQHDIVVLEDVLVGTKDLRIVLPRSPRIVFRLRLPAGTPVPDQITIHYGRRGLGGGSGDRWKEEPYEVSGFAGGCHIGVSGRGFAMWSVELDLEPGERIDLGTIALESGVTLAVRVIDPAGRPVPGATVTLRTSSEMWRIFAPAQTGEDGTCELPHMTPGAHELEVLSDAHLRRTHEVEVPASGGNTTIQLARGARVHGEIRNAAGAPVGDLDVGFHRLDGPVDEQERWSGWTDGQGLYGERMPPGRYRVEVKEKGRVRATAEITVGEGDEKALDFTLEGR